MCVDGRHGQDSGDACEVNRKSQLEYRQVSRNVVNDLADEHSSRRTISVDSYLHN